ncbi:hypothetical protein MPH_11472 [Macrophomina phaseolina MS6]|uniref:Uncharacterized protein n=1 Tax=Macrophomina phaseolina (strain MS6) TaxID=1126212 RepID=K2REW7_MACPH|nr:hypothetical protein MPH_11472 [Macrophomina phaseolina MS6]
MSSPPNLKLPHQSPEDVQETAAPATSGAAASAVDAPENAWSTAMPPPWSKTEEASHSASGRSDGVGHENVDWHVSDSVSLRAILDTDFTWFFQTNTGTSFPAKPAPSVASGWSRTTVSSANDMSIKSSSSAQSGSRYGHSMSTQRSRNNPAPPANSLSSVKEDIILGLAQRFRQVLEEECPPIPGCSTWPEAIAERGSSAGSNRPPDYGETSASGFGFHEHVAAESGKPGPEASDGSSGAPQQGNQRQSGAAGRSSRSDHARPKRKRNRSSDQADGMSGDEEGEDDGRRQRRKSPTAAEAVPGKPNFACPFYKRLPKVHNKLTSCVFPGFATIARLKYAVSNVSLRRRAIMVAD